MDAQKPDNPAAPPELAGFWIRLSAFLIDFVFVWLPVIFLIIFLNERLTRRNNLDSVSYAFILGPLITLFYQAYALGRWGQTLGKFLAGIVTVRKSGEQLGYLRSLGRTLAWCFFAILMFVPLTFFMPGCTAYGAGSPGSVVVLAIECLLGTVLQHKIFFYDELCGTKVVYKRPVGQARKMVVAAFGITVMTAISYQVGRHRGMPEKARVAEALSVIANVKASEERFLARNGSYTGDFTRLDISYSGMTAGVIATKFFSVSISTSGCGEQPCYTVTATRHNNNGSVAARYGLYSLNAIIPGRPQPQITSCPGGGSNCGELLQ